jgi:hypothetical protein
LRRSSTNLGVWKQNEIPSCIASLPASSILRDIREYSQSGKQTEVQPFDLSGLCLIPDLRQERRLLLLSYRPLLITQYRLRRRRREIMPVVGAFVGCRIRSGPPATTSRQNRPRLPCTFKKEIWSSNVLEHILMTGTMHWDSRQPIYERKCSKITNENSAKGVCFEVRDNQEIVARLKHYLAVGHRGRVGSIRRDWRVKTRDRVVTASQGAS